MRDYFFTGMVYLMLMVGLIPAPSSARKAWFRNFIRILQSWGQEEPIREFVSEPYFMWKYKQG